MNSFPILFSSLITCANLWITHDGYILAVFGLINGKERNKIDFSMIYVNIELADKFLCTKIGILR